MIENIATTISPAISTIVIDRISYFLSEKFVDDLAAKMAREVYELEKADRLKRRQGF